MKTTLTLRRCARRLGHFGLGARYLMPVEVLNGPCQVSLQSEVQLDLILWQVKLQFTSPPRFKYER